MIGGNTGINKRVDVLETEVYSPDFDQWTTVTPISMGQSEAGACVVSKAHFFISFTLRHWRTQWPLMCASPLRSVSIHVKNSCRSDFMKKIAL